ncbi:MAG: hypothetical protein SGPRY_010585, partial [Prymnesium sp.]
ALSVLESLRWGVGIARRLLRGFTWRALLLLRADIVLKMQLNLPEPSFPTQSIIAPFQASPTRFLLVMLGRVGLVHAKPVSDAPFSRPTQLPRVADNFFYVPKCRLPEFVRCVHRTIAPAIVHVGVRSGVKRMVRVSLSVSMRARVKVRVRVRVRVRVGIRVANGLSSCAAFGNTVHGSL